MGAWALSVLKHRINEETSSGPIAIAPPKKEAATCLVGLTSLSMPSKEAANIMCSKCPMTDHFSFLRCMSDQIRIWIGPSNSGDGPGMSNCNDYSFVFESVANSCPGFGAHVECGIVNRPNSGDPKGHCWTEVEIGRKCYIYDPYNDSTVQVDCPPEPPAPNYN